MPQSKRKPGKRQPKQYPPRFTVGLDSALAQAIERYAGRADTSMSKAIASLVRLGLEHQQNRKREFLTKLRENLADSSPGQEDRLVDEFRDLILGR